MLYVRILAALVIVAAAVPWLVAAIRGPDVPNWMEPLSVVVAAVAVVGELLVELIVVIGKKWRQNRAVQRAKLAPILQAVLERLSQERNNFEHIRDARSYSGEPHRQAVEDASFQLLGEQVKELAATPTYQKLAQQILAEVERNKHLPSKQKDALRLLELTDKLENKIAGDLEKL